MRTGRTAYNPSKVCIGLLTEIKKGEEQGRRYSMKILLIAAAAIIVLLFTVETIVNYYLSSAEKKEKVLAETADENRQGQKDVNV